MKRMCPVLYISSPEMSGFQLEKLSGEEVTNVDIQQNFVAALPALGLTRRPPSPHPLEHRVGPCLWLFPKHIPRKEELISLEKSVVVVILKAMDWIALPSKTVARTLEHS